MQNAGLANLNRSKTLINGSRWAAIVIGCFPTGTAQEMRSMSSLKKNNESVRRVSRKLGSRKTNWNLKRATAVSSTYGAGKQRTATEIIAHSKRSKSNNRTSRAPQTYGDNRNARNPLLIPILYESPDIVCINKPPHLLSQPGLPGEGTILDVLRCQRPNLKLQTVNR